MITRSVIGGSVVGGSVVQWVGGSVGYWSVVGGSVVGGFNKTSVFPGLLIDSKFNRTTPDLVINELNLECISQTI